MKRSNKLIGAFMEIVQILMVFLGVESVLSMSASGLELVYDRGMFLIILAVGSVLFYAIFSVLETIHFGKLYGIGGLLVFYIAVALRFREEIGKGVVTIMNSFLKAFMNFTSSNLSLLSYKDKGDVSVNFSTTLVMIILGVFLIAVISAFFYRKRRASVFIVATIPFAILPLYVGRIGSFADLTIYLSVLIGVIGTRQLKTNSTDRKLRQKLSVILVMVGLIGSTIAYIIVPPSRYDRNKTKLLETKNTIMALASWDMEEIFAWIRANWSDDAIDFGKIGRQAEVRHTGKTLVKISGDVNVNYGLYLKGYVGDVYEDNKWTTIKKDAQYKQDIAKLNAENIAPDSYHVQLRNDIGDNEKSGVDGVWGTGTLHVRNLAFGFGNYLIPVLPSQAYLTENDGKLRTRIPGIDYEEEYYLTYPYAVRRMLMTPSEDLVDPVFWTSYEEKTSALKSFAEKYYLQVPDELKGICDEFASEYASVIKQYREGESDISDVLRAVREYISKDTAYTEAPGRTPSGKDTVEYFLKESKKGYCTYYATAAAMLLRGIGIPTRFVEGLYVAPEELEKGIPGEIDVPDYDAHAWIEVYDARYGFVTFETTPGQGEQLGDESNDSDGYNGSGNGTGDGPSDATPTPKVTETPEESMEFEDIEGNEDSEEDEKGGTDGGQLGHGEEGGGILGTLLIILIVLVAIAAVAEGQRRIRLYLFRKSMSDMKNKRRRIRHGHRHLTPYFMHKGVKYYGQSKAEFAAEITEALSMPADEIECYVDMVFAAAFGPDDMSEQAVFRFREVFDDICRHAYKDAKLFAKLYYMYIMVL